jgi:hypothetical protein
MGYEPINWKDRQVQYPRRYTEVYDGDGKRTDTPSPGEIAEPGTQISATNLNKMDKGIWDAHIAQRLWLNRVRQNEWRTDALEEATVQEVGTKTLTNSQRFPFNNSKASVALVNRRDNCNYVVVIEEVTGNGNVGEVEVTDRLVNGFKLNFTGSATSVTVKYAVIGGYEKHD